MHREGVSVDASHYNIIQFLLHFVASIRKNLKLWLSFCPTLPIFVCIVCETSVFICFAICRVVQKKNHPLTKKTNDVQMPKYYSPSFFLWITIIIGDVRTKRHLPFCFGSFFIIAENQLSENISEQEF